MSAHTPGPWDVQCHPDKDQPGWYHLTPTPKVGSYYEENANAHLIAAAPELLVALDEIVFAVHDGLRRHADGDPNAIISNMIAATLRQAEAAIAKAQRKVKP